MPAALDRHSLFHWTGLAYNRHCLSCAWLRLQVTWIHIFYETRCDCRDKYKLYVRNDGHSLCAEGEKDSLQRIRASDKQTTKCGWIIVAAFWPISMTFVRYFSCSAWEPQANTQPTSVQPSSQYHKCKGDDFVWLCVHFVHSQRRIYEAFLSTAERRQ